MQSVLGIAVFIGVAWLLSQERAKVPWRMVIVGIATQLVLAYLLFNEIGRAHV